MIMNTHPVQLAPSMSDERSAQVAKVTVGPGAVDAGLVAILNAVVGGSRRWLRRT